MGPWSFPIVAEARMAERLLEVERERLARTAVTGHRSRTGKKLPETEGRHGRATRLRSTFVTGLAIAGSLVLGGLSAVA
jgi:hypothetical protein